MKEATEGCVEWPELDDTTFRDFVQFAYTGKYGLSQTDLATSDSLLASSDFVRHARLITFADRYAIDKLMSAAVDKLQNALAAAADADRCQNLVGLLRYCYCETTPTVLKSTVFENIERDALQIWADTRFQDLCQENPDLTFEFLRWVMPLYGEANRNKSRQKTNQACNPFCRGGHCGPQCARTYYG